MVLLKWLGCRLTPILLKAGRRDKVRTLNLKEPENLAELISAVLIEYPERSKLEEVAVELNLLTDSIHLVVLKNALEKMRKDHLQQIAQLQVEIESARAKAAQADVLSLEVQVYRDELNKAHQDLVAAELRNSELEEQLVVFTTRPAYPQELTPPQHKKLHAALQQAFPDLAELNRLVSVELGQNLVAICGNGTLADQIHCLVQWAEARGDLPVLLTAVAEARPRNHHLKAFFNSLPSGSTKLT